MEELEARVALLVARKFPPHAVRNVISRFGSAAEALAAPKARLAETPKVSRAAVDALAEVVQSGAHLREMDEAEKRGFRLLSDEEPDYPALLKRIDDPPALLYVMGALHEDDALALAIVGSRNATYYGTSQAARFAREFAARRITVVSGLARGVDSAAHKGALEGGGRTLAVVGSGLLDLYPPENQRLAAQIAEHGAVLSEFPLHTPGVARNFPQRNRVISGLSLGLLVVEAGLRSGSLITARTAGEQGREVFAIPGKVDVETSRGCHRLIRDGARLVESPLDVFEELPALRPLPTEDAPEKGENSQPWDLSPTEAALYGILQPSDSLAADDLMQRTSLPAPQVMAGLLMLEMKGYIKALPGRRYVRLDAGAAGG